MEAPMRRPLLLVPVVLLLLACAFATTLRARQNRPESDVLAALLIEVRGLRAALESLAAAGPRVQLAMGRLQLQEQRISMLVRRLDEVRDRRVNAERELENQKRRVSSLEETLRQGPMAPDGRPSREELEAVLRDSRTQLPQFTASVQRLQNEEAALSQDVAVEQGRWAEINQRLEELDRALGRR
jgi:chromosome segregation ATPase